MAARATAALAAAEELLLADLVVAECVYMLESFYEVERERVAELMRATIALPSIKTIDGASLLRALEVYEVDRLDFAEAYLVAQAEASGVGTVLSFTDQSTACAASSAESRDGGYWRFVFARSSDVKLERPRGSEGEVCRVPIERREAAAGVPTPPCTAASARSSARTQPPRSSHRGRCGPTVISSSAPAARRRRSPSTCRRCGSSLKRSTRTRRSAAGTEHLMLSLPRTGQPPRELSTRDIARIVGHADIRTTTIYTDVNPARLEQAIAERSRQRRGARRAAARD